MKTSTDRILTTHVGSLPRPQEVVDLLFAQDRGDPVDEAKFNEVMRRSVAELLKRQEECGIDIVSDGETSKISYATYIRHRLTGFEGDSARPTPQDLDEFPEYRDRLVKAGHSATYKRPVCKGPIKVKNLKPVQQDIAHMKEALAKANVVEGFMNAVSPGTIAVFQPNEYYPSHETYLAALADAMREEYELIVKSGLLLQLDCPDLAMGRHSRFKNLSDAEFLRHAELQVEALNHALANIPADRVRLHVCWGNYEGTHIHDMDCMKIFPIVLKVKPMALLIEAANPRHEHEWEAWTEIKLPDDKILIPGVIASSSNYVEHPEVVAQRLLRYANVVGKERVIAGSDCGFGTFAGFGPVFPAFAWMKFGSLAKGARLASNRLWSRAAA
jgi:5-methyltetrahydropteroyltriglutamate--homocysteine methyltransferase